MVALNDEEFDSGFYSFYNEDELLLSAWCAWAWAHGLYGERWAELDKQGEYK